MGNQNIGMPGMGSTKEASPRKVLIGGTPTVLPGGRIIRGAESRDPGNTGDINVLRAGIVLGRITSTQKYAPSIIGVANAAYVDGNLTIQCSLATATEVIRRIGTTGDLTFIGPAVAGGNLQAITITFTAVTLSGATSTITVPDLQTAFVDGSFICAADGSQVPVAILGSEYGIKVTDGDDSSIDVPGVKLFVGGMLDTGQVIDYPSELSLIKFLKDQLNHVGVGWLFSDDYSGTVASEMLLGGESDEAWYGKYTIVQSGASALNALDLDVRTNTTFSSGYGHALHINHLITGAHSGGGGVSQVNSIGIDATLYETTNYNGIYIYVGKSGSPVLTTKTIAAANLDLQEMGATDYLTCLWMQRNTTTKGTSVDAFILASLQGAGVAKTLIHCQGIALPDFFLTLSGTMRDMWVTSAPGAGTNRYLKVDLNGAEYKILMQSEAS